MDWRRNPCGRLIPLGLATEDRHRRLPGPEPPAWLGRCPPWSSTGRGLITSLLTWWSQPWGPVLLCPWPPPRPGSRADPRWPPWCGALRLQLLPLPTHQSTPLSGPRRLPAGISAGPSRISLIFRRHHPVLALLYRSHRPARGIARHAPVNPMACPVCARGFDSPPRLCYIALPTHSEDNHANQIPIPRPNMNAPPRSASAPPRPRTPGLLAVPRISPRIICPLGPLIQARQLGFRHRPKPTALPRKSLPVPDPADSPGNPPPSPRAPPRRTPPSRPLGA